MIVSQRAYQRELSRRGAQTPAWYNDPQRVQARAQLEASRWNLPNPIDLVDWSARREVVTPKNDPRLAVLLEDDGFPDKPVNRLDLTGRRLARDARAGKRQPIRPSDPAANPLRVD